MGNRIIKYPELLQYAEKNGFEYKEIDSSILPANLDDVTFEVIKQGASGQQPNRDASIRASSFYWKNTKERDGKYHISLLTMECPPEFTLDASLFIIEAKLGSKPRGYFLQLASMLAAKEMGLKAICMLLMREDLKGEKGFERRKELILRITNRFKGKAEIKQGRHEDIRAEYVIIEL